MNDELYIEGQLMDLDGEVSINLVYESMLFTDLNSITSNGTYNVGLPKTANNLRVIQNYNLADRLDEPRSSGYALPRDTMTASLYRNGLPIFEKGVAYLQNITDKINFVFTWGNSEVFKTLFDAKLTDL